MNVRYPSIHVRLVGEDGNAFAILGRVVQALKQGGVSKEEIAQFREEATSGDYDHLLVTVTSWVNTEDEED